MDYILKFNLTQEDLNILLSKIGDEDKKKFEMFSRIVKENFEYLNKMNISNMKDVFINHSNMFLMNQKIFVCFVYLYGEQIMEIIKNM